MSEIELKPCPFCGVVPKIEWEPWKDISETSGVYALTAEHKDGCYISLMNGFNLNGRMSAFCKKVLEEAWNRRVDNDGIL